MSVRVGGMRADMVSGGNLQGVFFFLVWRVIYSDSVPIGIWFRENERARM